MARMTRKPLTAEQRAEREQRTKDLLDTLNERATAFTDGERFRAFLTASAKFHRYSANNQFLIWFQRPDASAVGSYKHWQDLGRQVRKGEKGIRILAPRPRKITKDVETPTGVEEVEYRWTSFVTVSVFAYEQTDPIEGFAGTPWEPLEFPVLSDEIGTEHYRRLVDWLSGEGIPVTEDARVTEVGGFYRPADHTITIGAQPSSLAALHTLVHEAAHALHYATDKEDATGHESTYREVVAESAAYVVCAAIGFDTVTFSEQYVGTYGFSDPEAMTTALPMIQQVSHALIEALTTETVEAVAA